MLRFLILLIFITWSTLGICENNYKLIVGVHTSHFNELNYFEGKIHYNNDNKLFGIEKTIKNNTSVSLIYFNNSFYNDTVSIIYTKKLPIFKDFKAFMSMGIAYGYNETETIRVIEKHKYHTTEYIVTDLENKSVWNRLSPMVGIGFEYKYVSIILNPIFYNIHLKIPIY